MSKFKWWRKFKGGEWFYNRYIFDLGRGVLYVYERQLPKFGWSYNIEQYNEKWP